MILLLLALFPACGDDFARPNTDDLYAVEHFRSDLCSQLEACQRGCASTLPDCEFQQDAARSCLASLQCTCLGIGGDDGLTLSVLDASRCEEANTTAEWAVCVDGDPYACMQDEMDLPTGECADACGG